MFDIGFSELLVIGIVALIVLGPERLPKAARFAGLWVRRARAQWESVKSELERDIAAEELKRSLKDAQESLQDTERRIRESGAEAQREYEQMRASLRETAQQAIGDADTDQAAAQPEAPAAIADETPDTGSASAPVIDERGSAGTPQSGTASHGETTPHDDIPPDGPRHA